MNIKPKYLYNKEGEIQEVLLSYEDFTALIEKIEDLEDLIALREAREKNKDQPYYSIEEVMEEFGVTPEEEQEERRAQ
ncbi:MAG: DUF6290 family protein [Spirochaetota bacterium]